MPGIPLPGDAPDSPSPIDLPTLDGVSNGTSDDDGTGDDFRTAFGKINDSFSAVLGTIQKCAAQAWEIPTVQTANYTATVGGYCIRMDATSADRSVLLPPAADVLGHVIEICKWDSSANSVFAVPDGVETIYGHSGELTTQYEVLRLRAVAVGGWLAV